MALAVILAALALPVLAAAGSEERANVDDTSRGCSARAVEQLVGRLVGALDRGDVRAFDRLVAREPAFRWFSVSGAPGRRIRAAAFDRSTLLRYVRARHARGERQRLIRFRCNGVGSGGYANFDFDVVRSARDHPRRRVTGKGAVDCALAPPAVAVWSLGG